MKPEHRELGEPVVPRVTVAPVVVAWDLDFETFERTGEQYYFETVEQKKYDVDPFDEGLASEAYWAEGWDFGNLEASRTGACEYDGVLYRMFPARYRLADYRPERSLRRILKQNADLHCVVRPFRPTTAKDELDRVHCYSRFKEIRHPLSAVYKYLSSRLAPMRELTVFHPERGMIAFTLLEIGENASYAVRTAWNPSEKKRSLGTFTFLKALEYARSLGFEHHYAGPATIADPTFSYKLRYPACEIYDWEANEWVPVETERAKSMFAAPFTRRRWDPETEDWAE